MLNEISGMHNLGEVLFVRGYEGLKRMYVELFTGVAGGLLEHNGDYIPSWDEFRNEAEAQERKGLDSIGSSKNEN